MEEHTELLATFRVLQVELIARHAYQRVLLDSSVLDHFRIDESIRAFWSSSDRAESWGIPIDLESAVNSGFDHHKIEILGHVIAIDRQNR